MYSSAIKFLFDRHQIITMHIKLASLIIFFIVIWIWYALWKVCLRSEISTHTVSVMNLMLSPLIKLATVRIGAVSLWSDRGVRLLLYRGLRFCICRTASLVSWLDLLFSRLKLNRHLVCCAYSLLWTISHFSWRVRSILLFGKVFTSFDATLWELDVHSQFEHVLNHSWQ